MKPQEKAKRKKKTQYYIVWRGAEGEGEEKREEGSLAYMYITHFKRLFVVFVEQVIARNSRFQPRLRQAYQVGLNRQLL